MGMPRFFFFFFFKFCNAQSQFLFENVVIFFFLHVCREKVPELQSSIVGAHLDLCLACEFIFHFYFV